MSCVAASGWSLRASIPSQALQLGSDSRVHFLRDVSLVQRNRRLVTNAAADTSEGLTYKQSTSTRSNGASNAEDQRIKVAAAIAETMPAAVSSKLSEKALERINRRKNERATYLVAAIASSVGVSFLSVGAVVYRFMSQMKVGGEDPYAEIFGTVALAVGAAVGMEFWARWAHKELWHQSLWNMHESHHLPREGPFEANDIFAITNALPAIALISYGFFFPGLIPAVCFGAGLDITMFKMAYMFVHDGLVHRRFPVGPIADVPYLQRVAAAHQLHHADKYEGVPYGLFLGPEELEKVGGLQDLEDLLASRREAKKD